MPTQKFHFLNWTLLLLVSIFVCSFQTTFWFQILGGLPAPLLWLNILLYVSLYRRRTEAILINYALALVISPFTSTGLGTLWLLFFVLTVSIGLVKNRMYWPGIRYFILASFWTTLAYEIAFLALSQVFERHPADWNLYSRSLEIVLTPLLAGPIYWILSLVDRLSEREPLPERGSGTS